MFYGLNPKAKMVAIALLALVAYPVEMALAAECPTSQMLAATMPSPPDNPTKYDQYLSDMNSIRPSTDLLVIGDSFALRWPAKEIQDRLGAREAFIFGNSGDMTQHLIWRLQDNKLKSMTPKLVVVSIGTNNLYENREACGIVAGMVTVIKMTKDLWPSARVAIIAVPPRGDRFNDFDELRTKVNTFFKDWSIHQNNIMWVQDDSGMTCGMYGKEYGVLDEIMYYFGIGSHCENFNNDNWHPSDRGYRFLNELIADAVEAPKADRK